MARGKSKANEKSKRSNDVEFVSIRLDDDDKSALAEKDPMTPDEFFSQCDELISEGYKISVSMQENGSVNFTATCRDDGNPNAGKALSGWGDSLITAAMSFLYKHEDLAHKDWTSVDTASTNTAKFG